MADISRCIVSLTYDDALPCHFEHVAPLLEAHGLRATFYLDARCLTNAEAWRRVAAAGHELGNHTLFHPCYDADWQDPAYNLRHYTPTRWRDEVKLANKILHLLDERSDRSFGNTCHNTYLGAGTGQIALETLAPEFFVAARGAHRETPVDLGQIRWFDLGTKGIDGATFDELRADIESLTATGGWRIYTLHGVGPHDHPLYIEKSEHQRFIEWLSSQQAKVWTAPVRDVVSSLASQRNSRDPFRAS